MSHLNAQCCACVPVNKKINRRAVVCFFVSSQGLASILCLFFYTLGCSISNYEINVKICRRAQIVCPPFTYLNLSYISGQIKQLKLTMKQNMA